MTNRPKAANQAANLKLRSLQRQQAQRQAEQYLPPDWDTLSAAQQAKWKQAVDDYFTNPFWAEPLPVPPEVDAVAITKSDLQAMALLAAVNKVANQRGQSVASQLDAWNYGRGEN